jgi:hypothetical protein
MTRPYQTRSPRWRRRSACLRRARLELAQPRRGGRIVRVQAQRLPKRGRRFLPPALAFERQGQAVMEAGRVGMEVERLAVVDDRRRGLPPREQQVREVEVGLPVARVRGDRLAEALLGFLARAPQLEQQAQVVVPDPGVGVLAQRLVALVRARLLPGEGAEHREQHGRSGAPDRRPACAEPSEVSTPGAAW